MEIPRRERIPSSWTTRYTKIVSPPVDSILRRNDEEVAGMASVSDVHNADDFGVRNRSRKALATSTSRERPAAYAG